MVRLRMAKSSIWTGAVVIGTEATPVPAPRCFPVTAARLGHKKWYATNPSRPPRQRAKRLTIRRRSAASSCCYYARRGGQVPPSEKVDAAARNRVREFRPPIANRQHNVRNRISLQSTRKMRRRGLSGRNHDDRQTTNEHNKSAAGLIATSKPWDVEATAKRRHSQRTGPVHLPPSMSLATRNLGRQR